MISISAKPALAVCAETLSGNRSADTYFWLTNSSKDEESYAALPKRGLAQTKVPKRSNELGEEVGLLWTLSLTLWFCCCHCQDRGSFASKETRPRVDTATCEMVWTRRAMQGCEA